ncbi:hypothetical protein [Streptomyces sp. NRRL F-2580]|uniref:hypothetical protein n=1 Tax=Streptomyces sp. NRRL F-2580 TaxID=1463841 RepID=UPI0004CBB0CB|nr:hypothetical protein [Streptomyces sp. NRRL F-2580]
MRGRPQHGAAATQTEDRLGAEDDSLHCQYARAESVPLEGEGGEERGPEERIGSVQGGFRAAGVVRRGRTVPAQGGVGTEKAERADGQGDPAEPRRHLHMAECRSTAQPGG